MKLNKLVSLVAATAFVALPQAEEAMTISEAIASGTPSLDMRLRNESVSGDGADGRALTLRTLLGYKTASYKGFYAFGQFEDSRVIAGVDDYKVGPAGFRTSSSDAVIADPETTELDQAYLGYGDDMFKIKAGRQVVTMDNHRFVGHVGWRQDRQTFDGGVISIMPIENMTLTYGFLDQRNRIFAEAADIDSRDHLVNLSYKTPYGTAVGYAYLLENVASSQKIDSFGARFSGSAKMDSVKALYTLEVAGQHFDQGDASYDAMYVSAEGGAVYSGITAKVGYEMLGSDDGMYGFSTPLATLHKFNGWADMFLGTPADGLQDIYASIGTTFSGFKTMVVYHDFQAVEGSAQYGSEIDAVISKKLTDNLSASVKYANYQAEDYKVDTQKLWLSLQAKF
ncbi:MAG: alginate export family protein [Pseudomonadota bacterium]|nr:alginate export family protein [Pseudomonadota bacterium]